MITKERQIRKMKNEIRTHKIKKSFADQKEKHRLAPVDKVEKQRKAGEERRTFRAKVAKANGVRIERVKLTSKVEKNKTTYVIK